MAYLEEGDAFDEVVAILAKNHPKIKHIRAYARNAIRQTTGHGIYDDYIFAHNLWTLREPILASREDHKVLAKMWDERATKGRELIEMDEKVAKALEGNDETAKLLMHVLKRAAKR